MPEYAWTSSHRIAPSEVEKVNELLGINLWDVRSFRADVRIDFDEFGRVLKAVLLNPIDDAPTPPLDDQARESYN